MQAWIDLLLLANHKRSSLFVRGNEVICDRGQVARSADTFAKRWKWNKRTVFKFISDLEKRGMVTLQKSPVITVITIVKYDYYQTTAPQDAPQNAPQSIRRLHQYKNDKNVKNENNTVDSEILKWLRTFDSIGTPEGYLKSILKKFTRKAIDRAWKDAKRGVGIEEPADFHGRCSYWQTHL